MSDELLIKYLLKESDQQENLAVEEWLKEADHLRYFQQFELIWEESKALNLQSTVVEEEAWERFKVRRENSSAPAKKLFSSGWLRVAAIFLVIAGIGYSYNLYQMSYKQVSASSQVISQLLPDGSEITLNKNSDLTYQRNFKNNRNIRLNKGEAFFKVTPDKLHPFSIEAGGVHIRVVGTAFNVKRYNDETEVIVEHGIVRVSHGTALIELHKGEKVLIHSGAMEKETVNNQLYNYYRTKTFSANNTSLKELIAVLNEAYQADIIIDDPVLQELTITTTFKEQKLDDILQIIAATHNLKISRQGRQILLTK